MQNSKIPRNGVCQCGSGKKYKHCCERSLAPSVRPQGMMTGKKLPPVLQRDLERGVTLHQAGNLSDAALCYDRVLQYDAGHADTLHLRGVLDFQQGDAASAIARIQKAIENHNTNPHYFYHIGTVFLGVGLLSDAVRHFQTAIDLDPDYADAHGNLATALKQSGDFYGAIASYRRTLALRPGDAGACSNLGLTLAEIGDTDAATTVLQAAIKLFPDFAATYNNLGFVMLKLGRFEEATALFFQAIALDQSNPNAFTNLGQSLHSQLRRSDAIASFRAAIELDPNYADAHSNLLLSLQYITDSSPESLFDEHSRFAAQFETPLKSGWMPFLNAGVPEKRLKIGYVSGDFRNHAVSTFIEPILADHDAENFEIFCYYNHHQEDKVTNRLKVSAHHWRSCAGINDDQLAAWIRADEIDILIDLSGHTAYNRLLTFARKPAPIQVSWIGYPGTTGLSAIDYYLADRFWLPAGQFDSQFSEKLVQIPSGNFMPYPGSPEVSPLPALRNNGSITFASFNQVHKYTEDVVALWSQVLRSIPDSQMLIGGMPADGKFDWLIDLFADNGVERRRLRFHPHCDLGTYLALHHQVDICLDTFPYSGGTTTAHAAWMGVPTLTLAGATAAGRQGCGIPVHLGMEKLVTKDPTAFVLQAISLANDLPGLSLIRSQLRERLARSAFCQTTVATAGVEKALRIMWRRWCAGYIPESFEVPH